ncbi:MAG: hypothetical protein OEM23_04475, partial [Gemmatimonadota bacterium]|nr:hypothetical protein [Gemmatimonadota bacterium]
MTHSRDRWRPLAAALILSCVRGGVSLGATKALKVVTEKVRFANGNVELAGGLQRPKVDGPLPRG